jgi:hypothetical protein
MGRRFGEPRAPDRSRREQMETGRRRRRLGNSDPFFFTSADRFDQSIVEHQSQSMTCAPGLQAHWPRSLKATCLEAHWPRRPARSRRPWRGGQIDRGAHEPRRPVAHDVQSVFFFNTTICLYIFFGAPQNRGPCAGCTCGTTVGPGLESVCSVVCSFR